MRNNTTSTGRSVMAFVALIAGILLIFLVPDFGTKAMDAVLKGYEVKITKVPDPSLLVPAAKLVTFFFPFWSALCMVAGTALVLLSLPIYRGEYWARPIALGLLAIPSIAGAYMLGPIMFFAKGAISASLIIALTGLIPYFIILLYEKTSISEKLTNFFVFTMLGVTAAYNWGNAHSSLRQLWARPESSVVDHAFSLGIVVNWTAVILVLIGIPLLAARKQSGWWLATIGSLSLLIGTGTLYLGHSNVTEFLVGTLMALVTVTLLLIPKISGLLIDSGHSKNELIPPLTQSQTGHSA